MIRSMPSAAHTITTNAVTNAVDSALIYYQTELGGGINE